MEFVGNIPNISWPNEMLWRYMNIEKFLHLLQTESIYFSKVSNFNDPFEGVVGEATRQLSKQNMSPKVQESIKNLYNEYEKTAKNSYVSCWHVNNFENLAMWNIYSDLKSGIAIQTNLQKIFDAFKEKNKSKEILYVDKVTYLDFEHDNSIIFKPEMTLFYKRKYFEHEKELRIVKLNKGNNKNGIYYNVVLKILIENVYIAPLAPEYYKSVVQNLLKVYDLNHIEVKQTTDVIKV